MNHNAKVNTLPCVDLSSHRNKSIIFKKHGEEFFKNKIEVDSKIDNGIVRIGNKWLWISFTYFLKYLKFNS